MLSVPVFRVVPNIKHTLPSMQEIRDFSNCMDIYESRHDNKILFAIRNYGSCWADPGHFTAVMIQKIIGIEKKSNAECFINSKSLKDHLDKINHISNFRLKVDIARLKEMVGQEKINVKKIERKR